MIGVTARVLWFDAGRILDQQRRNTERALNRFGAYVYTVAKRSIRAAKKISQPGEPPKMHRGSQWRNLIRFAYDPKTRSVVIGPMPFRDGAGQAVLEKGGAVRAVNRGGKVVVMRYRKRPYMRPAFDASLHKAPEGFAVSQ